MGWLNLQATSAGCTRACRTDLGRSFSVLLRIDRYTVRPVYDARRGFPRIPIRAHEPSAAD